MEQFAKSNNIPSSLIRVVVIDGKKQPFGLGKNYDKNKLLWIAEQFKQNSTKTPTDEYFAFVLNLKETKAPIFCFDVDERKTYDEVINTYPFLKNTFYTKGNSKGFHFYLKINDIPKYSNEVKIGCDSMPDIDLIKYKKNMWEKTSKEVYGDTLKSVEWNNIKQHFNIKSMNFETERTQKNETIDYSPIKDDELTKLIDCLNDERAINADMWRIIGASIYHEKQQAGLPFFIKFSRKSNVHHITDYELEDFYNNTCSRYNQYTIGTIRYFAKQDKPEVYNALFAKKTLDCCDWEANEWAQYLKENVYDRMRYSNGAWFICIDNLWRKAKSNAIVVTPIMKDAIKNALPKVADIQNEDLRKSTNKKLLQLIKKVDTAGFHAQLEKYTPILFQDDDFENVLFGHVEQLVFRNGILNMATNQFNAMITPEDYVVKEYMIDWDYNPHFDENKMSFIRDKFLQIHNNNREQLKYALTCYGYALSGCRKENLFVNFKGVRTGNGKSTITDTLHAICPSLVDVMPQMVLQKDYNKRHKYLAGTIGKRLVTFEELPKDKVLDNGFIKDITGGVNYSTEIMYKESKSIRILWTPFANTNFTPTFESGADMERRYREINCDCKFWNKQEYEKLVANGKATDKDFEADNEMKTKLIDAKNEIIHILVAMYQEYVENGLKEPDFISEWSKETIECNNQVADWFEEHTIITQSQKDVIPKKKLELMLKAMHVSFKEAKDYLKSKGVKYESQLRSQETGNKWKGAFVGISLANED